RNTAGVAARLTKTGTGTITLSHANTCAGGTTMRQGVLVVTNGTGSATGVGKVQVNLGILRGVGKIAGAVTVGNGSNSGATVLGGNSVSPGILTIHSALTFRSFSSYKCALNRASVKASQVSALGVIIDSNATFTFVDVGTGTLPVGTVFTV